MNLARDAAFVEQARRTDEIELARFYHKYYKSRARWVYPHRLRWLFLQNPWVNGDTLPIWVLRANNEIVGHTGALVAPCLVQDRTIKAAWGTHSGILPRYRGFGHGRRLQHATQAAHDLFLSLWMSPVNRIIKEQIGGRGIHTLTLYSYSYYGDVSLTTTVLRATTARLVTKFTAVLIAPLFDVLRRVAERRHQSWIYHIERGLSNRIGIILGQFFGILFRATGSARLWAHLQSKVIHRRSDPLLSQEYKTNAIFVDWPFDFDSTADDLWARSRSRLDFAVERTSTYLNWRYKRNPHVRYRATFAQREGVMVALVVYRVGHGSEGPIGMITEVILAQSDPDLYADVVRYASNHLRDMGMAGVIVGATEHEGGRVLRNLGFHEAARRELLVGGNTALVDAVSRASAPMLSFGDHDVDLFPVREAVARMLVLPFFRRRKADSFHGS